MQRYRDYVAPRGSIGWLAPSHGVPGSGAGGDCPSDIHAAAYGAIWTPPFRIKYKTTDKVKKKAWKQ